MEIINSCYIFSTAQPTTYPAYFNTKFNLTHSTPPRTPPNAQQPHLQTNKRSVLAKSKLDWLYLCYKNTFLGVLKRSYQLLRLTLIKSHSDLSMALLLYLLGSCHHSKLSTAVRIGRGCCCWGCAARLTAWTGSVTSGVGWSIVTGSPLRNLMRGRCGLTDWNSAK